MEGWKTYQDFIDEAVRRAGGQGKLAKLVSNRLPAGRRLTQQAIQHLQSRTPKRGKLAAGSKYTHIIAEVTRLLPPIQGVLEQPIGDIALNATGVVVQGPPLETAQEVDGVELTKDAITVARAFMALPENEREEVKQHVEARAARYRKSVPIPADRLDKFKAPKAKAGTQ